ncbi:MAG: NADH-quinone oxidoreductase subunit H [Deltaproteobacteria bacterium]|nr:NADH-quinone oxidoreductase subunit H [Deltaproteobacteria bacterium]
MLTFIIATAIKVVFFVVLFGLTLSAILTWMERRQSAMMQDRLGPVRANIGKVRLWGLLHPLADALKLVVKEDFRPPHAYRALYVLAPMLALLPALLVFAVIPFGPPVCIDQLGAALADVGGMCKPDQLHYLQIANLDIGLLFVFGIASLGVYGAVLAGWSSNNNYALLGGLRAAAQMLSYEVTMGMAVMGIFLVYGSLEPMSIVEQQSTMLDWGIVKQPLGFILFFFAAIAETKRAPFDIPEGESEIVGYFVEYSGTRFMVFYLGEFIEIVFVGTLITTLYLGGWQFPGLASDGFHSFFGFNVNWLMPHWAVVALQMGAFVTKVFIVCFFQLAIRWTLPRLRYDQLMALGWKGLLPASIFNVVLTAAVMLALQSVK